LKVDFQGSRVTSDGGLILVRELDERLGFSELIEQHFTDSRGKNTQLPLAYLLRQSVYSPSSANNPYGDYSSGEILLKNRNLPSATPVWHAAPSCEPLASRFISSPCSFVLPKMLFDS
jgi:hypothetical protein